MLINRLCSAVIALARLCSVLIVQGNHDYEDVDNPTFGFLHELENVKYLKHPAVLDQSGRSVMVLPHARKVKNVWWPTMDRVGEVDVVLAHQAFNGAVGMNGHRIESLASPNWFASHATKATVIAGDIHLPQKVGRVNYVGAPYPINYGDEYKPRCFLYDSDSGLSDLRVPSIKKAVIECSSMEEIASAMEGFGAGDRVKVRLALPREEFPDWAKYREQVAKFVASREVFLYGCELRPIEERKRQRIEDAPEQIADKSEIVTSYAKARSVPESMLRAGLKFI